MCINLNFKKYLEKLKGFKKPSASNLTWPTLDAKNIY